MGVRHLARFVEQRRGFEREHLDGTLLADGYGLLHHALEGDRFDEGGDYGSLERTLDRILTCLEERNLQLRVYLDGPGRRMKSATRSARLAQRRKEWEALENYLTGRGSGKHSGAAGNFPMPPLALECFIRVLKSRRIEIIQCGEEADGVLAAASARGEGTIIGQDSDFLLFRDARYMPLTELDRLMNGDPVIIWTRDRVLQVLEITDVDMLLDLAVTLGNDFVEPKELRNPEDHLLDIKGGKISVSREEPAIAYSRALYNLEPIDHFEMDPVFDSHAKDGSPSPFPPPPEEGEMYDDEDDDEYEATANAVAMLAESLGLSNSEKLKTLCEAPGFREMYAPAVLEMLDGVHLHDVHANRWEDAVAAYRYQRALLSGGFCEDNKNISDLFDGSTFHGIVQRMRRGVGEEEEEEIAHPDPPPSQAAAVLPIDAHKDRILEHVSKNRVTIIVGETGCGKSSRLPIFLLESSDNAKMFVSQPRRIAARSLCDRVRSTLPPEKQDICGLRLGHGERDEHGRATRLWFCTTGYLVRLLASYPKSFASHTHLVIDEVHERSIDTDVLCLLARRLVDSHPSIRLVLMSATLCASLYKDYFGLSEAHIFVGARRFVNKEFFVEEVVSSLKRMPPRSHKAASQLTEWTSRPEEGVTSRIIRLQYALARDLVDRIGSSSSSILIFVAGMNDITELTDLLDSLNSPDDARHFETFPIHSDVPYEEQARVFQKSEDPNLVRVVIATNAAESSLTIPDCDHVICFGSSKQLEYNSQTHRQVLQTSWIAKASAIQRAGRTGRVRPGSVYRLYSRHRFEILMKQFDMADIHRTPLDAVVLDFHQMLEGKSDESIAALLGETLEPPSETSVLRAFESLFESKFLTSPDADSGQLTVMGRFVSTLGLDLQLGRLVGIGTQLDCLDEAIELAAILSQPQPPFRIAHELVHDVDEYNNIASATFGSRIAWDGGVRSEPIAILRILRAFDALDNAGARRAFCSKNSIVLSRISQLSASARHLRDRTLAAIQTSVVGRRREDTKRLPMRLRRKARCDITEDPIRLNRLRLLLTWTATDNLFCLASTRNPVKGVPTGNFTLSVSAPPLHTVAHLDPLGLPGPCIVGGGVRTSYSANLGVNFWANSQVGEVEARLLDISFGSHAPGPMDVAWLLVGYGVKTYRIVLYASHQTMKAAGAVRHFVDKFPGATKSEIQTNEGTSIWQIVMNHANKKVVNNLKSLQETQASIAVAFNRDGLLTCSCAGCNLNPQYQIAHLLGFPPFHPAFPFFKVQQFSTKQCLTFPMKDVGADGPLDMPLAARYLAALVGGYRKGKMRFWANDQKEEIYEVGIGFPQPVYRCTMSTRGKRSIFMGDHTLAKTDVDLRNAAKAPAYLQYGVAASMLDIGDASARAQGATFMPPGELWLARALGTFGMYDMIEHLQKDDEEAIVEINECANDAGESLAHIPKLTVLIDNLFCPELVDREIFTSPDQGAMCESKEVKNDTRQRNKKQKSKRSVHTQQTAQPNSAVSNARTGNPEPEKQEDEYDRSKIASQTDSAQNQTKKKTVAALRPIQSVRDIESSAQTMKVSKKNADIQHQKRTRNHTSTSRPEHYVSKKNEFSSSLPADTADDDVINMHPQTKAAEVLEQITVQFDKMTVRSGNSEDTLSAHPKQHESNRKKQTDTHAAQIPVDDASGAATQQRAGKKKKQAAKQLAQAPGEDALSAKVKKSASERKKEVAALPKPSVVDGAPSAHHNRSASKAKEDGITRPRSEEQLGDDASSTRKKKQAGKKKGKKALPSNASASPPAGPSGRNSAGQMQQENGKVDLNMAVFATADNLNAPILGGQAQAKKKRGKRKKSSASIDTVLS